MREEGPILLVQSAVGPVYEDMLAATHAAHVEFCRNNRVEFATFDKVLRGFYPWQSCYNRIMILKRALDEGYSGWYMHLDADAVIRHTEFDLRRFLGKRSDSALIACLGSPDAEPWAINDGVFFLNMSDERGREIASRWYASFTAHLTDDLLRSAVEPWKYPDGSPFPGDQHLLQMELKRDPELLASVLHEDPLTMNHRGAKFIRQFLRAHGSPVDRLEWIRETVSSFACYGGR
jgi:hypothetical protein